MKSKKTLVVVIVVVVLLVAIVGGVISSYNNMVDMREATRTQQSNVQTMLQRRADLIPNLVATVKGYASHEESVYTAIAEARSKLAGASTVDEMNTASTELESAISRLLVVVENYPDLKADKNFINLQDELAGTESRIAVARKDYNEAAQAYNTKIQKFPTSVIAGMFNFEQAEYFKASDDAATVPNVNFD